GAVRSDLAAMKNTAVDLRMQRLHPAVEHLGKPGEVRDVAHRDSLLPQQLRGAARRDKFDAHAGQLAGKLYESALIGDAQDGTFDLRTRCIRHGCVSWPLPHPPWRTSTQDVRDLSRKVNYISREGNQTFALAFSRTCPFSVSTEYSTAWQP